MVSAAKMGSRVQLTSRNAERGDTQTAWTVNAAAELSLYMSCHEEYKRCVKKIVQLHCHKTNKEFVSVLWCSDWISVTSPGSLPEGFCKSQLVLAAFICPLQQSCGTADSFGYKDQRRKSFFRVLISVGGTGSAWGCGDKQS